MKNKNRKQNLGKLSSAFTKAWKVRAKAHDEYRGDAEYVREIVIWYRIKWYFMIGSIIALGLCIWGTALIQVASPYELLWFPGILGFGFLSAMLIRILWDDRDERPGSTSMRLFRAWDRTRTKLIRSGIADKLEENQAPADLMNSILHDIASQVVSHEIEGRKSSKNRLRKELSKVKALSDELGLKTVNVRELFPKTVSTEGLFPDGNLA